MSGMSRRSLIGGAVATGAVTLAPRISALAQDATPVASPQAVESTEPGYATIRVRTQPSAELNQAIYPDVMARVLAPSIQIPGYLGYTFVFDDNDPASAFIFSTATSKTAVDDSEGIAQQFVAQLDPRFVTETPLSAEGAISMYATTDRPSTELPPFLHGAVFTMRDQTNAEGVDLESAVSIAKETLIPLFLDLPGFVMYCWFERPGGRIAINIWETHDDLVAASDALVAWRDEYFATPTASESVEYNGTIGYASIAGLT